MQLPSKFARVAAGAAIVGAAGLTTAVAVAQGGSGPAGSQYADYGYGYGGNGGEAGYANGHRLHCPSYEGMYHSKGHARCHYAPRGHDEGVLGADDDNATSTTSQSNVQSTTSRHDGDVRSDGDATKGTTSSTEADQNEHEGDKTTTSSTAGSQRDHSSSSDGANQDGVHRDSHGHRGSDSSPYESND